MKPLSPPLQHRYLTLRISPLLIFLLFSLKLIYLCWSNLWWNLILLTVALASPLPWPSAQMVRVKTNNPCHHHSKIYLYLLFSFLFCFFSLDPSLLLNFYLYFIFLFLLLLNCPVSWGCRIRWLHLCRAVRPPKRVSWIWH